MKKYRIVGEIHEKGIHPLIDTFIHETFEFDGDLIAAKEYFFSEHENYEFYGELFREETFYASFLDSALGQYITIERLPLEGYRA